MAAQNVVVFTTYPIVKPRHGGQIRARALVDKYRAAGFEVTHLAIYEQNHFPRTAVGPLDIAFPSDDKRWWFEGRDVPETADLRSGRWAAEHDDIYRQIVRSLPKHVTAFHVEQPWLFPLVKRLKHEKAFKDATVIYGSANVEAPLRDAIFRQLQVRGTDRVLRAIHELEADAARSADLTLAVAPADQHELNKWGARRVVLAPNGISAWEAPEKKLQAWRDRLNVRRFVLFVGSGHAPNVDGFIRAFGHGLGFIPPDAKIVIAGQVGPPLVEKYQRDRFNALDLSRFAVTGEVDDGDLAALKTLTSAFVLPIFEGGGSNIKTAEAIYSGKPVIATSVSMRGFDAFLKLPELTIANSIPEFRLAVGKLLAPGAAPPPPQIDGVELRSKLLWNNCLEVVPSALKDLLKDARS